MKGKVPDGLAYDCGEEGKAYIQFGGGGYLPGETALAKGNVFNPTQQARSRMRSTAKLAFAGGVHDLIAEWTGGGLRYRSEVPYKGDDYLVWTVGSPAWTLGGPAPEEVIDRWNTPGRPLTAEDARVGLRASADPIDEPQAAGEPLATCRRVGRDPDGGDAPAAHGDSHGAEARDGEAHGPDAEHGDPHLP